MYKEFFGFYDRPFRAAPDPRFLYFTPSHQEALDSIIQGIKDRSGFISITGEPGTGKTTLIYSLLNRLRSYEKVKAVYFSHYRVTFEQLLYSILLELDQEVVEE